jgi:hypothetical protein
MPFPAVREVFQRRSGKKGILFEGEVERIGHHRGKVFSES